jgi:3-oxoacyl-[acyl-carrier protein] reductase
MSEGQRRIALVTGGATGIGRACAKALAEAGFEVGIHYNSSHGPAEALVNELGNAFSVQADLSDPDGAQAIYAALKERGGVEVLVNNAGVAMDAPLFSAKLEHFDLSVATNMRAAWLLIRRVMRLMIRKKHGRIINISSVVGSTGNPGQGVYGMTKAALDNLTKTAALELAQHNILVNAVAPGFIDTAMTRELPDEVRARILERVPLGRLGQPEEVAEIVRFLATGASYCTGSVFHVNGGMYCG